MLITNRRPEWRLPGVEPDWYHPITPGWLPVEAGGPKPSIRWVKVLSPLFSEPFFHETVGRIRRENPRLVELDSPSEELISGSAHLAPVTPSGIVVHMTRCGSTLLLNGLKCSDTTTGLSEAQPIEHVAEAAALGSPAVSGKYSAILTPLTTVFAHCNGLPANQVVIKCGTSGIFNVGAMRAAWPHVPLVIIIRNPIEVLISNLRTPARWLQRPYQDPGGGRGHFALPNAPTSGVEEWCCWALGALCAEALRWSENNCKVLDYANISPATVCEVAEFFGIARPLDFMERVQAVFGEDAKRKGRKFEADAESKRGDATDTMLQATQRWVDPLYGQLRAKAGIR